MAGSDAWKMFPWIFQDFNIDILKSETKMKNVETVSDTWLEFIMCG